MTVAKLEALRSMLETQQRARLLAEGTPQHMLDDGSYYRATVKPAAKYTKIDFGPCGKYMVVNDTGEIFGIKAYGVIHRGHAFGTLETINNWDWSGYRAYPREAVQLHPDFATSNI